MEWYLPFSPYRDVQLEPEAVCTRCGGSLGWYDDGELCAKCKEELYGSKETG